MELTALDYGIIAAYLVLILAIGLAYRKRAGSGMEEFFVSGRSLPWWIAGTSMVATTFAADTPLAITGIVSKDGIAGNWIWWAMALGGMFTVFVFARLWRRAEVLTDVEFIELRYSGPAAAFLRGFRAVYVALLINSIIIGWVTVAILKVLQQTVLFDPEVAVASGGSAESWLWIAGMLALVGVYSILSGLWGVAITDFIQFFLAMGGCVVLAILAVEHVGGVDALQQKASAAYGGDEVLSFLPDFSGGGIGLPLGVFCVMLFCQWWSTWYPGAEPGGGGYVVQRMAACKNERHAVLATLWYQIAHYCVRPWPWILVSLAALAMFPHLRDWATDDLDKTDPGLGFPMVMREVAPAGLRGLLLVTFGAAFMSTISTQMNWGASYLVNDVYKRFLRPDADDRTLAAASRWASALVLVTGGATAAWMIETGVSVDKAWKLMLALGAGTGAVFMLRWFWWRINAYTEIAAMISSFAMFMLSDQIFGTELRDEYRMAWIALGTIAVWLLVTMVTRPEPEATLRSFFRRVHPAGPGWRPVAALEPDVRQDADLGRCLLAVLLGTGVVYLTLPGIGALIFGRVGEGLGLLAGAAACGAVLIAVRPKLMVTDPAQTPAEPPA